MWAPQGQRGGLEPQGCGRVASVSLGKDTLQAESRDKTRGGQGLVRHLGCRKQGAAPPSTLAAPPPANKLPAGHTEDRFSCSMAEGGGESSSCRNQEKQVF